MASIAAKKPTFAPFTGAQPAAALPKYGTSIVMGKLVKADVTVTNTKGELYADDALSETVEEFSSAAIAMETDDMKDDVAVAVYGATLDSESEELTFNGNDAIPYGGLTYYKTLRRNGEAVFKGYYYPKVKAAIGNDSAATKGSSITFGTTPISFTVFQCETGAWRVTKEFDTEAACVTWIATKLAASV